MNTLYTMMINNNIKDSPTNVTELPKSFTLIKLNLMKGILRQDTALIAKNLKLLPRVSTYVKRQVLEDLNNNVIDPSYTTEQQNYLKRLTSVKGSLAVFLLATLENKALTMVQRHSIIATSGGVHEPENYLATVAEILELSDDNEIDKLIKLYKILPQATESLEGKFLDQFSVTFSTFRQACDIPYQRHKMTGKSKPFKKMTFKQFKTTAYFSFLLGGISTTLAKKQREEVVEFLFHCKYKDINTYVEERYEMTLDELILDYFDSDTSRMLSEAYATNLYHGDEIAARKWLLDQLMEKEDTDATQDN